MTPRSRQKFVRNFIGSLMLSDLSISDMQDLLFELEHRSFNEEIARALRDAIFTLRNTKVHSAEISSSLEVNEKALLAEVQRRKISKRALGEAIERVSPKLNVASLMASGTSRGMIQKFFDMASPPEVKRLADLLTSENSPDAYLRGIIRRD